MEELSGSWSGGADVRNHILGYLKNQGIQIPEEFKDVFMHHIDVLAYRLAHNECVSMDDEELQMQISPENMKLAEDMLEPLFKTYSQPRNKTEEALIAIYISMAKGESTL